MKKLIIILMALFSIVGTTPGFAAKRNIMELPIFERLVVIVKHFETLHNGLTTWPFVGYGHMKLPGEKYYRGYKMSEQEADALLRNDLRKFCALYEKYGKDKYLPTTAAPVWLINPVFYPNSKEAIAIYIRSTPVTAITRASGIVCCISVVKWSMSPCSFPNLILI